MTQLPRRHGRMRAPTSAVPRLVLGSASPARLATLRSAGLDPAVLTSGVDELAVAAGLDRPEPAALALALAAAKCAAVAAELRPTEPTIVVGCDSVLELGGEGHGRPADAAEAVARWHRMRGRSGLLHTGHCVRLLAGSGQGDAQQRRQQERRAVASTRIRFADLDDAEIEAYVASGEPLQVAGAFTIDGLGGAYVTGVDGDPHNVVGISLPLLRELVGDLGIAWHTLWARAPR